MRDDERIRMYYKFGLLDWKSELEAEQKKQEPKGILMISFFDLKKTFIMLFKKYVVGLFRESRL